MLPRLSAPVSGVDCPCPWFHANSLLSSRPAVQSPTASLPGRVVNSHSRPLTTSGYGKISGPRILCLVLRQNRQRNHLLWQPTHIVLQTWVITEDDMYPIHMGVTVYTYFIYKMSLYIHISHTKCYTYYDTEIISLLISLYFIIIFMDEINQFSRALKGTIYQPLRSGRIWHKVNF